MTLRTYRHRIQSYLITPQELEWVEWFAQAALREAQDRGKEIKDPRKKLRYLRAHKLCCLGFSRIFGLQDQWEKKHTKLSLWPPKTDFIGHGHKLRIVSSPLDEAYNFGASTRGRVWDNDFNSPLTGFILVGWFVPYVDVIGWLPKDQLRVFKKQSWYELSEPVCWPVASLPGFRSVL